MLSKIEEISLIAKCVAGDDRAFEKLVNEHGPAVRNFLFRLTLGDAALADDLAQETFLKAYSGLHLFHALSRFRTWLFTIAYNEFVSYMRRNREERLPDGFDNGIGQRENSSEKESLHTELRHDIQQALAALADTERTLITLFYFDDLPIKEICKITALPSGTVKSYLSRAKNKLAKELESYEK